MIFCKRGSFFGASQESSKSAVPERNFHWESKSRIAQRTSDENRPGGNEEPAIFTPRDAESQKTSGHAEEVRISSKNSKPARRTSMPRQIKQMHDVL
jgi:hypothetical protein